MTPTKRFSLVIPAYDEEENLPQVLHEVDAMLQKSGWDCEILLVNDGSKDGTLAVMHQLRGKYPGRTIRILDLDGNYGLSAAFDAGFRSANCDVIASMDADLQNDPADLPRLLEKIEEYDVVIGVRSRRQDSWLKKFSSRFANSLRDTILKEKWTDTGCSLKVYKKSFLANIKMYTGMHRFLPTLLQLEGARVLEVPVNHRPRIHGKSKYHLMNRLTGPLGDLMAVRWMKKRYFRYHIREK